MGFLAKRPERAGLVFAGFTLCFPLVAGLSVQWFGPVPVVGALVCLLLARAVLPAASLLPAAMSFGLLAVAAVELAVSLYSAGLAARLYPVFMNATMLIVFAATLYRPPSMIERFARLQEPGLDESGVAYTRVVTQVWIGFFMVNGGIALWTALVASWPVWSLYNGVISYLLMGLLFVGEYLVRRRVRHRSGAA